MHDEITLIATIAVSLACAFAGGLVAVRLGLPSLVGYLLAGAFLSITLNPLVFAAVGRLGRKAAASA